MGQLRVVLGEMYEAVILIVEVIGMWGPKHRSSRLEVADDSEQHVLVDEVCGTFAFALPVGIGHGAVSDVIEDFSNVTMRGKCCGGVCDMDTILLSVP
jgi:hypothetical protein